MCRTRLASQVLLVVSRLRLHHNLGCSRLLNSTVFPLRHLDVVSSTLDKGGVSIGENRAHVLAVDCLAPTRALSVGRLGTGAGVVGVTRGVTGLDDLGNEFGHVHFDVKFDEVRKGMELEVAVERLANSVIAAS